MSFFLLLTLGCNDEKKPHEAELASPSAIATALGIDASVFASPIDPEKPAGDLAADIAAFTTVDACMKQRATSLDPLVGDAVDAIGYDTFLRDACRVLEAAKSKDAKKCELIDASSLRARCRTVTAMIAGDADSCPLKVASHSDLGRDATCVAAALRSPAMCAGAQKRERPACEALASHDTKKCDALALDAQRASCVRDATRFRAALVGDPIIATVPSAKGTLTIQGDGRADPAQTSVDMDPDISSGVVMVVDGKHVRATLGRIGEIAVTPHATQPLERTRFAFVIASDDGKAEIAEASLSVPGATQSSCTGAQCTIAIKITKLEAKRGGAVEIVVEGTLGGYRVHADVATFTRDVVPR